MSSSFSIFSFFIFLNFVHFFIFSVSSIFEKMFMFFHFLSISFIFLIIFFHFLSFSFIFSSFSFIFHFLIFSFFDIFPFFHSGFIDVCPMPCGTVPTVLVDFTCWSRHCKFLECARAESTPVFVVGPCLLFVMRLCVHSAPRTCCTSGDFAHGCSCVRCLP